MKSRPINVFSLSFLDLFSCALAGVIILMLILVTLLEGQRADRRVFIVSAEVTLTHPDEARVAAGPLALFGQGTINPAQHIQMKLITPHGQEIDLPLTPGRANSSLLSYTARRPPHGQWRLVMRPSSQLRQEFAQGRKPATPNGVPSSLATLYTTYEQYQVDASVPWNQIRTMIDDETKRLRQPRHVALQRIRLGVARLRENGRTNPYGIREQLNEAQRLVNKLEDIHFDSRDKAILAGVYADLVRAYYDSTEYRPLEAADSRALRFERSPRLDPMMLAALTKYARHVHDSLADSRLTQSTGMNRLIAECHFAHSFGAYGDAPNHPLREVLFMMSGAPFKAPARAKPYHWTPEGIVVVDPLREPPVAFAKIAEWAFSQPSSLPLETMTDARTTPMMFAASRTELAERMLALLPSEQNILLNDNCTPVLFYFSAVRGQHQDLDARMKAELAARPKPTDLKSPDSSLEKAAQDMPLIYFEALGEAIRQQELSLHFRNGIVHWGSQLKNLERKVMKHRTLLDVEPIMAIDLYPDEILVTHSP